MKKIITLLLLASTSILSKAGCDWSGYWMKKVNQQQNVFTFQTNIDWNNCVDYWWIVYDHQLKRQDTLQDLRGFTQVQFNSKGKYTVNLKVVDVCKKCDTTFSYLVDITVYGKADVSTKPLIKDCKSYEFEMTGFDTCVEYYYSIYKGKYFDTMSTERWEKISDSAIYFGYEFDEKDLVYYNTESKRKITNTFSDSGRHLVLAYWYNRCSGIDTWVMRKIVVCPSSPTTNTKNLERPEPRLVAVYDMLGRPVKHIREGEIMIFIYDDGSRKKVVQQ